MADETTDPRPSSDLDDIGRIARAATPAEAREAVTACFGPHVGLFVTDHEFRQLTSVDGLSEQVELSGGLRRRLLRNEPHFDGERTWTPLPERNDGIFVVAQGGDTDAPTFPVEVVGALLGGHRQRFEDFEQQRRRRDMTVAAEMQWDTLPLRADTLGAFDIAGLLEPAYEVAGDVFDYALLDGSVWAYSFDGMGHGIDATVSGLLVLAAIRNTRRQGGSLVDQMSAANELLFDQYEGDRFVTGVACRIEVDGSVAVVNAGHEPVRTVIAGAVARLDLWVDLPLGVESGAVYRHQHAAVLEPGDGLVMFSDGPSDQITDGACYGADRLESSLEARWSVNPLETGHHVIDDLLGFTTDAVVDDDATVVIIRRHEEAAP